MYVCMHACMYACMYICMYACMYACEYIHICVCMYIYIYNVYICICVDFRPQHGYYSYLFVYWSPREPLSKRSLSQRSLSKQQLEVADLHSWSPRVSKQQNTDRQSMSQCAGNLEHFFEQDCQAILQSWSRRLGSLLDQDCNQDCREIRWGTRESETS